MPHGSVGHNHALRVIIPHLIDQKSTVHRQGFPTHARVLPSHDSSGHGHPFITPNNEGPFETFEHRRSVALSDPAHEHIEGFDTCLCSGHERVHTLHEICSPVEVELKSPAVPTTPRASRRASRTGSLFSAGDVHEEEYNTAEHRTHHHHQILEHLLLKIAGRLLDPGLQAEEPASDGHDEHQGDLKGDKDAFDSER